VTTASDFEDVRVPTRYKLSSIWTTVMFCYIYADYFELYIPGKLQGMLNGSIAPLGPVTQGVLVGTATMLAVPSLMVMLSITLRAPLTRWLNVIFGSVYTLIQLLVVSGSGWAFYSGLGILEAALTAFIVWTAWKWPKANIA
jgi:hypothetical protein